MQRLPGLPLLHMKKSRIFNYLTLSALLVLGSGLSACSSFTDLKNNLSESIFGAEPANPPAELEPITASYEMRVAWSADVGEAGRFT